MLHGLEWEGEESAGAGGPRDEGFGGDLPIIDSGIRKRERKRKEEVIYSKAFLFDILH